MHDATFTRSERGCVGRETAGKTTRLRAPPSDRGASHLVPQPGPRGRESGECHGRVHSCDATLRCGLVAEGRRGERKNPIVPDVRRGAARSDGRVRAGGRVIVAYDVLKKGLN